MKTVEQIKHSKHFEPYFLWYLKANMMMPRVIQMVIRPGNIEHTNGLDLILNQERSGKALITELKKHVETEELPHVVNQVCQHYVETIGRDKIMDGTPELLIFQDYAQN